MIFHFIPNGAKYASEGEFALLFLSSYANKIDKKGRISVPASFRTVLASENFHGIVCYHSFVNPCIEASGMARIERISAGIDALDPFSEERDAFATSILGAAIQLAFDGEGRVVLPENILCDAGLKDQAVFVGKGQTFEIWSPEKYKSHAQAARKLAMDKRAILRLGGAA